MRDLEERASREGENFWGPSVSEEWDSPKALPLPKGAEAPHAETEAQREQLEQANSASMSSLRCSMLVDSKKLMGSVLPASRLD